MLLPSKTDGLSTILETWELVTQILDVFKGVLVILGCSNFGIPKSKLTKLWKNHHVSWVNQLKGDIQWLRQIIRVQRVYGIAFQRLSLAYSYSDL